MLQAAAASMAVPLHRIKWVTCSHANNILVTRLPRGATRVLIGHLKFDVTPRRRAQQVVKLDICRLIMAFGTVSVWVGRS